METCEAFILRKSSYGEADLLVTLFSREFGKFGALAKNAKKSRKRFGGRFDIFNHLVLDVNLSAKRFSLVGDVTLKKSHRRITESVDSFDAGTRALRLADFLAPEREPSARLFDLLADTLELLGEGKEPGAVFLVFLAEAVGICGYAPDFRFGGEKDAAGFDVENGKVTDFPPAGRRKNVYRFHPDIMERPETMEAHPEKVENNIRVLIRYTEYQTGRRFRKTGLAARRPA